jgi:hypothetical protein
LYKFKTSGEDDDEEEEEEDWWLQDQVATSSHLVKIMQYVRLNTFHMLPVSIMYPLAFPI